MDEKRLAPERYAVTMVLIVYSQYVGDIVHGPMLYNYVRVGVLP